MQKISVSPEAKKELVLSKQATRRIVSWFPVDLPNCECQPILTKMKKTPGTIEHLECPKDKKGYKNYKVACTVCKSDIAILWAKDATLKDWCDLHYITEHDSEEWNGCMAVNISPFDLSLGFECTCGNDTRDFRANTTLSQKELSIKIKETEAGRAFNTKSSKFSVTEVK